MTIVFARALAFATPHRINRFFGFFVLLLLLGFSKTLFAGGPSLAVSPMPVISHNTPVFTSGAIPGTSGSDANDGDPASMWVSTGIPAWIAYDLSAVPATQRRQVLAAWYANFAVSYDQPAPTPDEQMPIDYTIEINSAPGGKLPTTGWQQVVSLTGQKHNTGQHLFNLAGANWVRLSVTASSDPHSIAIDFDVHSAPNGESDSWLFMGDSITGNMAYIFSEIPSLVHGLAPDRWPVSICAALGGTNSFTAGDTLDANLAAFTGRYVILAYGTNDGDGPSFSANMEALVLKIIAAGKIPVIPHMPWSSIPEFQVKGPDLNARIDALYLKYPIIRHGPDLWAGFMVRTDLIPVGDVHPNDAGAHELRRLWAVSMTANNQAVSVGLAPGAVTLSVGGTTQFSAVVGGSDNLGVTWQVREGSTGGNVSLSGLYTAPSAAGTFHVVATSVADSTKSATATVSINAVVQTIAVTISPSTASLNAGEVRSFNALVSGSTNTLVTWSIQEGTSGGTISSAGLYTAPAIAGTYHVVATSQADNTISATAIVTVAGLVEPISVTLSPDTASLVTGATTSFTATVTGSTNQGVSWSVREGSAGGKVSSAGVYTAPSTTGIFHVVATSGANSSRSATALVTVTARPSVRVSLTPKSATVSAGGTSQFAATVTGATNTEVTWRVREGASAGTVSATGLYTAPTVPGTYHVVATSKASTKHTATATIVVSAVVQPVVVSITPSSVGLNAGTTRQFSATVTGLADATLAWSIQEGMTGGTISSTGLYTAPAVAGTYHVVATSNADSTQSATASVTVTAVVQPAVTISVAPSSASVSSGATLQFSATVIGSTDTTVTWSIQEGTTGGNISSTGLFVAPGAAGTFHVLATSNADVTKSASATVMVTATPVVQPIAVGLSPTIASVRARGTIQFTATITGTTNLGVTWAIQEGGAGGSISATGLYTAPPTDGTFHVTAKSNADATKSASGTVVVSTTTTLKSASVVRILRDDHVATLEMDYNAANPVNQWWTMTDSGKDDAGFLITWWPDGSDPLTSSKWMVTANRRAQIQPLANNGLYHVSVQRINALGEITSLKTELIFSGGDSTRVDALRSSLTYFDDFNLPTGSADEKLWNNAATTSTDPRFNLFFVNGEFHAHSLDGTSRDNTGDKSQTSQRFRHPIAIENGVRRRIVFDMDSPLSPRSVWYLDFNPITVDLTGHTDFFDDDGALGLPAGVLRLRSQGQTFSVDLIDTNGASHQIATADMEALGHQAVSNVRRAFDVRAGTDGIQVFIDGVSVINATFPANAFKAGDYSLLWDAFGYNTTKENNPYFEIHWDNFGFDGPVRESRAVHNYVTRIAGTDYQKSDRSNSTFPTFVVKIPDDLKPVTDNATAEAWLVYTYQMGDFSSLNLLPTDSVQVNGRKSFTLPPPINNSSPLNPDLLVWGMPHTARIKLGDLTKSGVSPLVVGDNTFKFLADSAGLLNVHVEVFYPQGSEPVYTPPASIFPFPTHSGLPEVGPPARIEMIGTTEISRDAWDLDLPANLVVPVSGIISVKANVGNESYSSFLPDLMVTPVQSNEVASTGGTLGIATVEFFLRSAGVGPTPGNRVALIQTNRDAPAPQGRYSMQLDTRTVPNGNYQLFVLATSPTGIKSNPKYGGVGLRWDASQLAGAYYPITINVQN